MKDQTASIKAPKVKSSSSRTYKGKVTKQAILKNAFLVLAKCGVEGFSLTAVAKKSQCPTSLVSYHFGTLDNLFEAVILWVVDTGRLLALQKIQLAKTAPDQFRAWIDAMFEWIGTHPTRQKVMLEFYIKSLRNPRFKKLNDAIVGVGIERVRMILVKGVDEGSFPRQNLTLQSEKIHSVLTGIVLKMATGSRVLTERSFKGLALETALAIATKSRFKTEQF